MLIELWRKVVATEYSRCCAICGDGFDRENVFPVASADDGRELGEICRVCLDHLTRRLEDPRDPSRGNWPASGWPTLGDLEEARWRYLEPMFADDEAYDEMAQSYAGAEDEAVDASVVWKMERERVVGN